MATAATVHDECEPCKSTLDDFKQNHGIGPKFLTVHVTRDDWKPIKKSKDLKKSKENEEKLKEEDKTRKTRKLQQIEDVTTRVAALRNSKGGQLLIHLYGQRTDDWNHEWFDKIVVDKLLALIEDGQLFVDTFSVDWYVTDLFRNQHTGFLVLAVTATGNLTTANFHTKLPTDISVVDPSTLNIISVLHKAQEFENKEPQLLGIQSDLTKLHESRHIQFKRYMPSDQITSPDKLVDYIWEDLRLREYICAFSRVESGGSYFLGIREKIETDRGYERIVQEKEGIVLSSELKLATEKQLLKKIDENILISDYSGRCLTETASDLKIFEAKFHEHLERGRYILEVAVRPFSGFLFYNKQGPTAHLLDRKGDMVPVNFYTWFEKITNMKIGVKRH